MLLAFLSRIWSGFSQRDPLLFFYLYLQIKRLQNFHLTLLSIKKKRHKMLRIAIISLLLTLITSGCCLHPQTEKQQEDMQRELRIFTQIDAV